MELTNCNTFAAVHWPSPDFYTSRIARLLAVASPEFLPPPLSPICWVFVPKPCGSSTLKGNAAAATEILSGQRDFEQLPSRRSARTTALALRAICSAERCPIPAIGSTLNSEWCKKLRIRGAATGAKNAAVENATILPDLTDSWQLLAAGHIKNTVRAQCAFQDDDWRRSLLDAANL